MTNSTAAATTIAAIATGVTDVATAVAWKKAVSHHRFDSSFTSCQSASWILLSWPQNNRPTIAIMLQSALLCLSRSKYCPCGDQRRDLIDVIDFPAGSYVCQCPSFVTQNVFTQVHHGSQFIWVDSQKSWARNLTSLSPKLRLVICELSHRHDLYIFGDEDFWWWFLFEWSGTTWGPFDRDVKVCFFQNRCVWESFSRLEVC